MSAILKYWLDNGCLQSPEEMYEIIKDEYKNKEHKEKELAFYLI